MGNNNDNLNAGPGKTGQPDAGTIKDEEDLVKMEEAAVKEAEENKAKGGEAEPEPEADGDAGAEAGDDKGGEGGEAGAAGGEGDATPKPPEKTLISDADRKHFKIPDKFKYMEDVVAWGTNAEKAKSQAETRTAKTEGLLEDRERIISDMQNNLDKQEKKGNISAEENEKIALEFRQKFEADPIGTMQKLFDARDKRNEYIQQEKAQTQQEVETRKSWEQEEVGYQKEFGEEKWLNEVKPALTKIAVERPYLRTMKECMAILNFDKDKQVSKTKNVNKADAEEKRTEKKTAFSEGVSSGRAPAQNIYDKIAGANTEKDLAKVAKQLPHAPVRT